MRFVIFALILLSFAGCAGLDAAEQYSGIEPVHFQYGDDTWRIFDKPAEGRLMITPSLGRTAANAALAGPFGTFDTDIPKPQYQAAVEVWLAHTGRRCTVLDGYKLITPQWEFKYRCE